MTMNGLNKCNNNKSNISNEYLCSFYVFLTEMNKITKIIVTKRTDELN